MARANQGRSLGFNYAGSAIKRDGIVVAQSQINGQFTADVLPEVVKTEGGASILPSESRSGRADGAFTMTMRERPTWIEGELMGGTTTSTAASATPAASAAANLVGSSVASALTILATGALHYMDFEVEATGASEVRVRVSGSNGAQEFPAPGSTANITLSSTATAIGNTGVSISAASANFTTGDRAAFSVTPGNGGVDLIGVPQVRTDYDYEVVCYSGKGGGGDAIIVYTFPRVHLIGANVMLEDMAIPEVEITGQLLAPRDGSDIYTRRLIYRD